MNGGTIEKDDTYYFSNGAATEIKELNVENLKLVYSNNQTFHNLRDSEFNSAGITIHIYDIKHKMFRVNYLLSESKK